MDARELFARGWGSLSVCVTLLYTGRLNFTAQDAEWIAKLRSGDPRILARAISAVENRAPGWSDLLKSLFPHTGHARVIGITGAPGAGKSTLVDQLAKHYRKENQSVGIIAVDPSSPYTGGAILGDRIRMQDHYGDPGIFIRSMATRGSLGGLAGATVDAATVLDASGRDVVMIETVGVGQDEIDIVRLANVTVVILVPGMGDDVQTIKAGIMEIADIFVINKSDHPGAERVEREIRAMQSLATRNDRWTPSIIKTVANSGEGIAELAAAITDHGTYLKKNLAFKRNVENWQQRLIEMLREALLEKARSQVNAGTLERYAAEIAGHKRDPYSLVEEIVRGIARNPPALASQSATTGQGLKPREEIQNEIVEIVDRETRAWNTKDVELLVSVFHPDMVWPWPPSAQAHDPVDWVMVLGRYDRERWQQLWRELFDRHTLVHNRRHTQRIEISEQGDGALAVVDVDTLWRDANGQDFHWKGRACKVYSWMGSEWKMTMHTGLLQY